ncbi:hypothetical protein C7974DRAFT_421742 [Boeremia exigua]|uniref:uncharacterized protein n=1 Tax=Boeremia exigua TaxID=749465 RepID=UPI001E8D6DFC|nr:uncharacterized protein C7974DRAFT_421742 [Boeremia exigua]KAH6639130.1 hypothetical protein C7974DRAFT_421742 [Boeremia exigua]
MSLKPAPIAQNPYFYPTGNTPAVCLTDTLAPDVDANVLLLGCGDIRNVLFTTFSGAASDRKLDFTCCDLEAEIIARNAVALTLIANDAEGSHFQQVWNIYYHVFIDDESMQTLQAHVKSLLRHAQSLETWKQGPHASLIRFCDETTFEAVVKLWKLYAADSASGKDYNIVQTRLKDQWKTAQRHQIDKVGDGVVLDGVRAAAPALSEAFDDVSKLYRTFWSTGTCLNGKAATKLSIANPMFGCLRSNLLLHYGQSPLTGFHLAPAYTQLATNSPLTAKLAQKIWPTSPKALQVAFEQFVAWITAFRQNMDRVTVRFVNADALAFSYVLRNQQANGKAEDPHWYRSPWTFERLVLSEAEYTAPCSAPVIFNVIDTSNLMDHLGSINLLAAVAPLLERTKASTIRTEMMVPREASVAESTKVLLCGDLSTMASLFGLKPIQYWTNATATWSISQAMLRDVPKLKHLFGILSRPIILWKPLDISRVRYDAKELARFLYNVYLNMHSDESWAGRFSVLGLMDRELMQKKMQAFDLYTRAGLTALLRCIKDLDLVDWPQFVKELVAGFILNDGNLNMGPHHFQSLCVNLEIFSIAQVDQIFDWWNPRSFLADLQGPFECWNNIPSVVCVTLVVPHNAITMFSDVKKGNGTPLCQIQIQSSRSNKEAFYPDIQLGFGTVQTSGKPFSNQYNVAIAADSEGWKGTSPLVVSAMVSTASLVEYGDTAAHVTFALKSTPSTAGHFTSRLGLLLHLHRSRVGRKDVYITRYRPSTTSDLMVGFTPPPERSLIEPGVAIIKPSLTATHVTSVQVQYHVTSEAAKSLLQNAAVVAVEQPGPFELELNMGSKLEERLEVPFPLDTTASKTRISRKQCWVEFTAPVADINFIAKRADAVFPVHVQREAPSLEHLAYVDPDPLPMLRLDTASWLVMHTSYAATMSGYEVRQYEKAKADDALAMPGRLGVKESLHSMCMHMTGLCGLAKSSRFCLTSSTSPVCIILVDCIRMDLSHQTVFLDAALLSPLPAAGNGSADLTSALAELKDLVCITINDDETLFWKHLLPAFAERCRQWKHKDTCEYQATRSIPVSTDNNKPLVCSCGVGIFPADYLKSTAPFKILANLAVRIAIPVIFASPISKDDVGPVDVKASHRSPATRTRTQDAKPEKRGCLKCGAATTKAGNKLLKCAKCKTAQYCSPDCQKRDWKKHRQACKQMQEDGVGDDAA